MDIDLLMDVAAVAEAYERAKAALDANDIYSLYMALIRTRTMADFAARRIEATHRQTLAALGQEPSDARS
jgi:hypothetical protein